MSNLVEILSKEQENGRTIYFYREGVFYKAYEQSAYLFVKYVKPFLVKKKHIKSVNQNIVSVGFPTKSLINYFPKEKIKEAGNTAEVELDEMINQAEFISWKEAIEITEEKDTTRNAPVTECDSVSGKEIIARIRVFPMEQKTPLDCMLFLAELKSSLQ